MSDLAIAAETAPGKQEDLIFQLSEADEQIVRTYQCTRFKRWFRPETIGYLTVTNKRVVYHSTGKSFTGQSLLINEMPLEDVSGLSVYKGSSVGILGFIVFAVVVYALTWFVGEVLPGFFTSYGLAAVLMLPYLVIWLFSTNILNAELHEQACQSIENLFQDRFRINRDVSAYLPYVALPLYAGLVILAWRIGHTTQLGYELPFLRWVLLLAVYGFIYSRIAGRSATFSLLLGSRAMQGSGIYIPGDSFRLLSTLDMTAVQSLGAGPAADAGQVARELGALLLDIQQLGDHGIEKWKLPSDSSVPIDGATAPVA